MPPHIPLPSLATRVSGPLSPAFMQAFRFSSSNILIRLIQTLSISLIYVVAAQGLVLHNPVSASEYVEIVPGKPVTLSWTAENGDPSSFKIKLRNRKITDHQGQWVLADNVSTASNQITTDFLDLPADPNYYVEADVYAPTLTILYSGVGDMFPVVDAASAHLRPTSSSAASTSKSPTETPVTETLTSTITFSSGYSVIAYTVTTERNAQSSLPTSPDAATSSGNTHHSSLGAILGGVLGGVCAILVLLAILLLRRRRSQRRASPSVVSENIRPFSGFTVDNKVDGKSQLQQVIAERDALERQHDSLQMNASNFASSSASRSGLADTEVALRHQIQAMNDRILQLEAQVNSDRGGPSFSEPPPPNYVAVAQDPVSRSKGVQGLPGAS